MEKQKNLKKEIGKRIEFIRNQKELTKEGFAKLINISGQHLGKVITGQKGLSIEKIVEIAKNNVENIDETLKNIIY